MKRVAALAIACSALACFPASRFERAAETADMAAQAWEYAGELAGLALEADRATTYTEAMNAVNAALKASNDAIDAGRSLLPNMPADLEAKYAQAAGLDSGFHLSSAASLIRRGRRAEGTVLLRDHLKEVDQKAPDIAIIYRSLAGAWRATAAQLQAER